MPFSPIARYYDAHHGRLSEDIPFYLAFAADQGGPILDLGAGTARLALAFARQGFSVTGIDTAGEMLAIARRRVDEAGMAQRITLVEGDYREFDLDGCFALACCGFNGFLHLIEEAEQVQALLCWRRHLQPGGLLLLDVENPSLERLAGADGSIELGDQWLDQQTGDQVAMFYASRVSFADQVHEVTMFYDAIGQDGLVRRSQTTITTRILFRRELDILLRLAGFEDVAFFGDYEFGDWTPDSERILAVARA